MDGTFCSYNDRNAMCYSGKCIPVGCDGKLNSGAKDDMCGECKGDNSQCTLRQDYYNEKLERGKTTADCYDTANTTYIDITYGRL